MKLPISCMQCFVENGIPSYEFQLAEVNEQGTYISVCSKGHKTMTVAQMLKYEFLLDLGFLALRDGYPREAITNFATAIERFYEFYVRVVSLKFNISKEQYDKSVKHISLSERQLGAFIVMYMIDHVGQLEVPILDNVKPQGITNPKEWKKFRNNVIHNGLLPTHEEGLAYGKLVYEYLFSLCEDLMNNNQDHFNAARMEGMQSKVSNEDGLPISSSGMVSILTIGRSNADFDTALKTLYQTHDYIKDLPNIINNRL